MSQLEQRLIDANEPYEKIQSLIEDLKPRGRLECIRGLEEALDIIEFSKTVEWGENDARKKSPEPKKL